MARNLSVLKQTTEKEIPKVVTSKKIRIDSLMKIQPKTVAQRETWMQYEDDYNLVLHGMAGTGKTFLSLYLAMRDILSRDTPYDKLIVVRSVVPVRESGFLPGTLEEKEAVYELPYVAIFNELFRGTPDVMDKLKEQQLYKFISTSYIRGITLHNAIVVVDETNNCSFHELDSIITRLGENCKIIFCGDKSQTDFHKASEINGIRDFTRILDTLPGFRHVEFLEDDIVRSDLVKQYIIGKHRLGL